MPHLLGYFLGFGRIFDVIGFDFVWFVDKRRSDGVPFEGFPPTACS
jgi:hypothetical protein